MVTTKMPREPGTRQRVRGADHDGNQSAQARLRCQTAGVRGAKRPAQTVRTGRSRITCSWSCSSISQSWPKPRIASMIGSSGDALLGELVLDAGRRLGEAVALDDPLLLEHVQPLRERARADARARVLELGEAARALREVVHDQGRPLRADQVRGGGDGAGDAVVYLVHPASRPSTQGTAPSCAESTPNVVIFRRAAHFFPIGK